MPLVTEHPPRGRAALAACDDGFRVRILSALSDPQKCGSGGVFLRFICTISHSFLVADFFKFINILTI